MHHAGTGTGKATHLPQRGVPADAGLLAERTPAEDGHQGHPQPPAVPGQEPASLPGYPRLKGGENQSGSGLQRPREGLRFIDSRPKTCSFDSVNLVTFEYVATVAARPASMLDGLTVFSSLSSSLDTGFTAPSFPGNLSNVYQSV